MSAKATIGKIPGMVKDILVNGSTTLAEAIEVSEIGSTDGFEIRINDQIVDDMSTIIKDGDDIVLARKTKGAKGVN